MLRIWSAKVFVILMVTIICMALAGPVMAKNSKRVLVGFKASAEQKNAEARGKFVKDRGGEVKHSFRLIRAVSANMSDKAIARLKARREIAYIEEDIVLQAIAQETPWGISRVHAPTAWGISRGAGVDVAILDTGIDSDHPDLDGNIAGGVNFAGTSADGSTNSAYWNDVYGHGTHCAGIVAAEDNSIGVVGIAPDADLWAVKVLSDSGSGYTSDIIQGLEWCADNGIEVASMSFGGGYTASMEDACNAAYANGVLLVAAAGNGYGAGVIYPAAYGSVIAVSAIDQSDNIAIFSSIGLKIELAAPGTNIYSTYPGGGYAYMNGTSMACPHVSGVAALVFANGISSATGVRQTMNDTACDIGLIPEYQGNGLVDAVNAVGSTEQPAPVALFWGSPTSGQASLTANFTDESIGSINSWSWNFGDGGSSNVQNPSHTYNNNGTYTVSLTVGGPGGTDTCTYIDYIVVESPQPVAALFSGAPTHGEAPLTVSFADESTGSINDWSWIFGDGGTSNAQDPSHTYENAGTYTVCLTVTGADSSDTCINTNYIVVVAPAPPVANFSGDPTSGGTPLTVSFDDISTGNITEWYWDFGDGLSSTSVQQNPSHTYFGEGAYTVSLTVIGPGGSDTVTRVNYVNVEKLYLSVADITLQAEYRGPKKWQVTATIAIRDSYGNPVPGATVYGSWSGSYNLGVSGTTGYDGKVRFETAWMKTLTSSMFTVTNVVKTGYEYNSVTESSSSIKYGS